MTTEDNIFDVEKILNKRMGKNQVSLILIHYVQKNLT